MQEPTQAGHTPCPRDATRPAAEHDRRWLDVGCRAIVALALAAAVTAPAAAFTAFETDGGVPVHWDTRHITVGVSVNPPSPMTDAEAAARVDEALRAWGEQDCYPIDVTVEAAVTRAGDPEDRENTVVWVYKADDWNRRFGVNELGRTFIIHGDTSGRIVDADIYLNLAAYTFSATEPCDADVHDLRSVLVHEAGHLFGLDHSDVAGATMTNRSNPGECDKRTLETDDIDGYCASYTWLLPAPGAEEERDASDVVDIADVAADAGAEVDRGRRSDDCAASGPGGTAACLVGLALALLAWRRGRAQAS